MNINRSNNRRRGRGSNRGPGGGNQANRIDNRARGNAPQMLEKYKKLAHDASLNDDRVQTEYYLQFADHYFRVIADGKSQKDEHRPRRDSDPDDSTNDQDEEGERDNRSGDDRVRAENRRPRDRRAGEESPALSEGSRGIEGDELDRDDSDNPFVRDTKAAKPRGRVRRKAGNEDSAGSPALDPDTLPPSIARDDRGDSAEQASDDEGTGKSRARTAGAKAPRGSKRRSSPAGDEDSEALKAAS